MPSRKDLIRENMKKVGINVEDRHGNRNIRFHHILYKREEKMFSKMIIGDSIVFGCARKNCLTYCFPGAAIEHLHEFPKQFDTTKIQKICLYLGTNNFLGSRNGTVAPEKPEHVFEKYKTLVQTCADVGFDVHMCPLFGIQSKREAVLEFNRLLKEFAHTNNYKLCNTKDVSYYRDIGDHNKEDLRDGIHPTVRGTMKVASCFTF